MELGRGVVLPCKDTVLSEVVRQHEARYRSDLAAEDSAYRVDKHLIESGLKSDFLVPLWVEKECLGTLNVAAKEVDGITPAQRQIVSLLTPRLAQVLKNAQLFDSVQQSEEKYKNLVEGSPDIVYTFSDKRGGIYYSSRVESILGYTAAHLCANPFLWHDSVHPEDLARIDNSVNNLGEDGDFEIEYRIKDAKGHWHWFKDRSIALNFSPDETTISGLATDITERKTLESQLQQALKMEAVGIMAGGIAHDFNNILSIIFGATELAMAEASDQDEIKENLRLVIKAAHRAKDLVAQILSFSRQAETKMTPVDLQVVVQESLKLLRASIPTTIDIQVEVDPNFGSVLADATQIHQILSNLALNAVHAMNEKGILTIRVEDVHLNAHKRQLNSDMRSGRYVKLSIGDTGTGVAPEIMDQIFDPFFTTKDVGVGSGMGLSVVHGVVMSHRGFIEVRNEPGQGASFDIYFPVVRQKAPVIERAEGPILEGHERILFVDDEKQLAALGEQNLSQLGYVVTSTTSSVDALEIFRSAPEGFDLIITDQTMPQMSGVELAAELLRIRPGIPIILCTGYSSKVLVDEADKYGVRAILTKPFSNQELAATIRNELGA